VTSFRFRLERVRAVRERKEKIAQRALAQAISRRSDSATELRTAEAEVEHARAQQRRAAAASVAVSGSELMARQAFLERVEATRRQRARELAQRDSEVAQRDAQLATAATEHEMLNRLRDRQRREHDRESARRELSVSDEIATVRYGRSPA
jgi:flagellar protein FliJ